MWLTMVIKKGEDKMEEDKTNEIEEEKDPIIIYFKKWYEENLDRFQLKKELLSLVFLRE